MIRLLTTVAVFAAMAGTAHADCTSPAGKAGALAYAGNFGVMAFCNGTQWVSMAGGIDVTINGSGSGALSGLSDVALTTPAPGDFLNFNGTDWVNVNPFGTVTDTKWCVASSGRIECNTDAPLTSLSSIDDLADVDTSGAAPNSILAWNGSTWVVSATTIAETDPQVGTLTNSQWCTTDGNVINCATAAPVLTEADPKVGTLTNGQWCTTDGSVINCSTAAPLTASAVLNDLADVDTAGVAPGKILAFDGTNWVISDSTVAVSAGGNPTNVQFNNSGNFGGSDDFTWANSVLTVNGVVTATQVYASQVSASQGHIGALTGATGSLGGLTVSGDASISRVSATDISGTVLEMIGTTFTSLLGGSGNAIASATSSVSTSSDNTIKFATNGSQRMVIDATGQLGIGTTAPNALVDVAGLISTSSLTVNGVAITGGTSSQWTTTGSDIYYNTGKVGIGTNNPSIAKLQIASSGTPLIYMDGNASTDATSDLYIARSSSGATIQSGPNIRLDDGTATHNIVMQNSSGNLTFWNYGSSAWNERMRIDTSGNVGIGTTGPSTKLFVTGSDADYTTTVQNTRGDATGNGLYVQTRWNVASNYIARFATNSGTNDVMAIKGDGKVGIGTTSPGAKLDVFGGSSSASDHATLTLSSTGENGHILSFNNEFGAMATIRGTKEGAGAAADEGLLTFSTAVNAVSSERMRITSAGNVGINSSNPNGKLEVSGVGAGTGGSAMRITGNAARLIVDYEGGGNNYYDAGAHLFRNFAGTDKLYIASTGVTTVYGSGGTCMLGDDTTPSCTSDERLKTNINPIGGALDKISKLDGVTFHWKDKTKSQREHIGLIAQNVERVFPQAVGRVSDTTLGVAKTVAYSELVAPMIEAIKELKAANDNLRNEHAAQLKALRAEMEALKKAIQH